MGNKIEIDEEVLESLLNQIKKNRQKQKRQNGTGSVVFLGSYRYKPYAARILIGKDINGRAIYYDIDTFKTELEAIVCLENYHKNPTPLQVYENKYNRIVSFPQRPYPLVPVSSINADIHRKDKRNYTFKQVFEEMKESLFPTKEEIKLEKEYHIKAEGKFGRKNASNLTIAFNQSKILYNKIFRELRTSDFKTCINSPSVKPSTKIEMVKLFKHMDNYAYAEDIVDKKYTENLKSPATNYKTRVPFAYEDIKYLWSIQSDDFAIQFVRDFLLLAIYEGCRAEELLFIFTKNIFLDKNYFIAGIKTKSGTNRAIPIHQKVKHIIEKYYNKNNEFLFNTPTGKRITYAMYLKYYKKFIKGHPLLLDKTAHCGRHALETELQKLNIKQTIINSILGHANGNVADDVYNHVSIEEKIEAINMVTYEIGKLCILKSKKKVS
ncbi:MAG: tyrosine-type recombinase/integrase [Clostridia bacterium]|nr:tyrosine-type recombinase/integrase [Clostridia bacterium]